MSAFMVFDPQDSLIFVHCDPQLESYLLNSQWFDNENIQAHQSPSSSSCTSSSVPSDTSKTINNLLALYLTPYVSMQRYLTEATTPRFDGIPRSWLAHQQVQQFVFVYLHQCQDSVTEPEACNEQHTGLQRKVSIFTQLVCFFYGHAFYSIDKYNHLQRILLHLMTHWESIKWHVPFMIESIEKLPLGFHLETLFKQTVARIDSAIKLQMLKTAKEIPTCYLLLYRDRLLYKQESSNAQLRQEDLLCILLLSLSVDNNNNNVGGGGSSTTRFNDSVFDHLHPHHHQAENSTNLPLENSSSLVVDESLPKCHQHLVFLKSSHNYQIPLPHLYRRVMFAPELYFVTLSEVSSILMISLPTLIQSVSELRVKMSTQYLSAKKSIEMVESCVRSVDKYIHKNIKPAMRMSQLPLGSLERLNELAKRNAANARSRSNSSTSQSSELAQEQADRILSLVQSKLHHCYEDVAFKVFCQHTLPQHAQLFQLIVDDIKQLLCNTIDTCIDYIHVKYETNSEAIANACGNQLDLTAFVFVDRRKNYFVKGSLESDFFDRPHLLQSFLWGGYQRHQMQTDSTLVSWQEDNYRFAHWHHKLNISNQQTPQSVNGGSVMDTANGLTWDNGGQPQQIRWQKRTSANTAYELFCVFKESPLNAQLSVLDLVQVAKLIKLYING